MTDSDARPWRNFYGRRHGKGLRQSQLEFLDQDLAALSPGPVSWDDNPTRKQLDMASLMEGRKELWLEIGFGGGEHLVHQAAANPDVLIIGCEPFINGVAMLLGKIREAGVTNLKVHPGDARDLFDVLPDTFLSRVFLLYPDPWPKKKHRRRRFVNPEFLDPLASKMAHGAHLRIATDIESYVSQTLEQLTQHDSFEWLAQRAQDWREAWPDWYSTRYEQKALREGRRPHYMTFAKV